eukprot:768793-Hanusia_phi.AAC.6
MQQDTGKFLGHCPTLIKATEWQFAPNMQLRGFGTKRSRRKRASSRFLSKFDLNRTSVSSIFRSPPNALRQNREQSYDMENDRTRERVKKKNQYLIVIDASNILHHGGNGLNCKEEEVLVILDFWVADKLGEETLKQIRSAHQYTRVTRKGVTADVRIIQTAYAVQACIVSNDMFLDYCPFQVKSTPQGSKLVDLNCSRSTLPPAAMGNGGMWYLSEEEWAWAYRLLVFGNDTFDRI